MASEPPNSVVSRFGPNEWLVDEIYEQYLRDKNSVDPAWWDFFEDYAPVEYSPAAVPHAAAAAAPAPTAPEQSASTQTTSTQTTSPAPSTPASTPASTPPPDAATPPSDDSTDASVVEPEVLRGAAGRVVTNMEASLSVPTATSVRSVPVKLLMDNRVVINNHLSRGRGGKVSLTHVIGFAVVRAMATMPEMGYGFTQVDGKPAVLRNEDMNLVWQSTSRKTMARGSCLFRTSRVHSGWTSPLFGPPTKTWSGAPAAANSR